MQAYIALIHKDADSDFGVSFPDFPGCISAGRDLDEAHAMGAEALALHIEGLAEMGEAIPEPSSLTQVMAEAGNRDGVAVLIPAPSSQTRAVRVNITLPEHLLFEIDRFAESQGLTRSGFLAEVSRGALEGKAKVAPKRGRSKHAA